MRTDPEHTHWHGHRFCAMGGQSNVWLEIEDTGEAEQLLLQVEDLFAAVEQRLSRFRAGSELSMLNRMAGRRMRVSAVCWQVLTRALQLAAETGGLFDPTVHDAVVNAGYDRSFALMATEGGAPAGNTLETAIRGRWQEVEVDAARGANCCCPQAFILILAASAKATRLNRRPCFSISGGPAWSMQAAM